jgi:hypothetical protein
MTQSNRTIVGPFPFVSGVARLVIAFSTFSVLISMVCVSCGPFTDARQEGVMDLTPPAFVAAHVSAAGEIELEFTEDVVLESDSLIIKPDIGISGSHSADKKVVIDVAEQQPGTEYRLEAVIADVHKNSSNVLVDFYGYNPLVPGLLINEFITNGTDTHPDLVELKVMKSGNMAGVAIYAGIRDNWDSRLIFPSFEVQTGDFILVHFKPQGIASEVNETGSKTASSGLDFSSNAYDFWVAGGTGLSGSNGTISVYSSPTGSIIDGVLYSDRTKTSDTLYQGFGTDKTAKRATGLVRDNGWKTADATVAPEDGINVDSSTSTRSVCRNKIGTDTNSKSDWHVVPTKKASFGAENSEEVYVK